VSWAENISRVFIYNLFGSINQNGFI